MRRRLICGIAGTAAVALALAGGAAAIDTRTAIAEPIFNPCTFDSMVAQGFVHITSDFRVDSDGSLHDRYHLNMEGMTAKTLTGVKYVVQEEWNVGTNADDDHSTIHHIFKQHYVRTKEDGSFVLGDDFYLYVRLHLTVNAQGTPTAMKLEMEEEPCQ